MSISKSNADKIFDKLSDSIITGRSKITNDELVTVLPVVVKVNKLNSTTAWKTASSKYGSKNIKEISKLIIEDWFTNKNKSAKSTIDALIKHSVTRPVRESLGQILMTDTALNEGLVN